MFRLKSNADVDINQTFLKPKLWHNLSAYSYIISIEI